MFGCLPTPALAFLAVFVYATHAKQAIAFEWKPGFRHVRSDDSQTHRPLTITDDKQDCSTTIGEPNLPYPVILISD